MNDQHTENFRTHSHPPGKALRQLARLAMKTATEHWSWGLIAVGLGAMYIPTIWDLFHGLWSTDQNGHGPIVLGIAIWLTWYKLKKAKVGHAEYRSKGSAYGWFPTVVGILMYYGGRTQEVYILEVGSAIPIFIGIALLASGPEMLKKLWFAIFFLLFMIPLPGSVTDAITQPLKLAVSWGADNIMYSLDYPTTRTGVIITIGGYQLLVADACAGLNSLFTLEAIGLLYLNVVKHSSALRNIVLASMIVPISFASNVIRVITLCLLTYHFGDEVGQGFVHEFSGMLLFMTALFLIISLDSAVRVGISRGK